MKDQTSLETVDIVSESVEQEEQIPPKKLVSDSRDAANRIESDEDSGFLNLSNSSLDTCEDNVNKNTDDFVSVDEEPEQQLESQPWKLKIVPKSNILSEEDLINKSKELVSKLQEMPEENRKEFAFETYQKVFDKLLPDNLVEISAAFYFDGDSGISMDVRPDWLDMEKFRRGQRFARDYMFGLNYSQLLSLFVIFSFTDGLRTLIATGASSTPYTSFKRYLSTALRIQNWYMYDPWTRDTPAYKDLQTVRKMHAMSRKKMETMSKEEIIRKTTIKDAWCPALNFTRRDFQSTCPAPKANQCAYTIFDKNPKLKAKEINQGEMISTQFSFIGIFILNPKFFGVHYACDEDLEAYCHVWRGIGYLLGIDDQIQFSEKIFQTGVVGFGLKN